MKILVAVCCMVIAAALPAVAAAQKTQQKKGAKKPARVKIEKLACRLGTEDEHARIAVQLANGKVEHFAYYSKWKPRTCSMDVKRGDVYSKWVDTGDVTIVTLMEDTGAILIDHSPGRYHFMFREIDRMRYCGMEGKVNGTVTIFRGRPQCQLAGVMDREIPEPEIKKPAAAASEPPKPAIKEAEEKKPATSAPEPPKPAAKEAEERKSQGGEPESKPAPKAPETPAPAVEDPVKASSTSP